MRTGQLPDPTPSPLPEIPPAGLPGDLGAGIPDVSGSGLGIPETVLAAYRSAATTVDRTAPSCGLTWPLVAGIGKVESGHASGGAVDADGTTVHPILGPQLTGTGGNAAIPDTDGGALDHDAAWDRAVGPTQFIPSSWRTYGADGNGDGRADPDNVFDAGLATARYLCSGGGDLTGATARHDAVFRYNHSESYVATVLGWADAYASGALPVPDSPGSGSGSAGSGSAGSGSAGTDDDATLAVGAPRLAALPSSVAPAGVPVAGGLVPGAPGSVIASSGATRASGAATRSPGSDLVPGAPVIPLSATLPASPNPPAAPNAPSRPIPPAPTSPAPGKPQGTAPSSSTGPSSSTEPSSSTQSPPRRHTTTPGHAASARRACADHALVRQAVLDHHGAVQHDPDRHHHRHVRGPLHRRHPGRRPRARCAGGPGHGGERGGSGRRTHHLHAAGSAGSAPRRGHGRRGRARSGHAGGRGQPRGRGRAHGADRPADGRCPRRPGAHRARHDRVRLVVTLSDRDTGYAP